MDVVRQVEALQKKIKAIRLPLSLSVCFSIGEAVAEGA